MLSVRALTVYRHGKNRGNSVLVHLASRRGKADLGGDLQKTIVAHGERFDGVGRRFDDFGKRFDDVGKRFDDLVNRVASNERTSMAFLGLGVGLVYFTGSKIDKQSADLNAKIDKQTKEIHEINVSLSKLVNGNTK